MRYLALVARQLLLLAVLTVFVDAGQASAAGIEAAPYTGRWIDVSLTTLRVTAYQGTKAVYTIPVTTGKPGFATPTGTYHIISRFRVQDMKSSIGAAQPYFQPNVEFIQYFYFPGGFALHANYWSPPSVFGRLNASHGCVGMARSNAILLWNFASVGTPVYVHYGATRAAPPVARVDPVVGSSQAAASALLKSSGLKVATKTSTTMLQDPGTVMAQTPAAGLVEKKGSTVTLTVAAPRALATLRIPQGEYAWAPDVVGLSEADAVARIQQAGLRATYVNYFDQTTVPAASKQALLSVKIGAVFSTLTPVGQQLPRGSDYVIAVRRS